MSNDIRSVAFSRDNHTAFISDNGGNIKMIKWKSDANSGNDFDFTHDFKKVGNAMTQSICLTKDEKFLLVGSNSLVSVLETATREVVKEFKMLSYVQAITLIQGGKRAIIADTYGNLSIIDLETLEILSISKKITNPFFLSKIIVI